MSDIQTLFPNQQVQLSTGETIEVSPFKFGQLPLVLSKAKSLFESARGLSDSMSQSELVFHIMAAGGEDLISLVAVSINKPRAWFDSLGADDGIKLTTAFLEVNIGFFVQRVLPEFRAATSKLKTVTGQTPSSS